MVFFLQRMVQKSVCTMRSVLGREMLKYHEISKDSTALLTGSKYPIRCLNALFSQLPILIYFFSLYTVNLRTRRPFGKGPFTSRAKPSARSGSTTPSQGLRAFEHSFPFQLTRRLAGEVGHLIATGLQPSSDGVQDPPSENGRD